MKPFSADFHKIVPHLGSEYAAFEELCCQNARRWSQVPDGAEFVRYRGEGGDGGVECIWRLSDGEEWGWQVKWIFELTPALAKLSESLKTALSVHPRLSRYTVCLPFVLTGPTAKVSGRGSKTESLEERFNRWRENEIAKARACGRTITIHREDASSLIDHLQTYDPYGGRLRFWFDMDYFGPRWFTDHLEEMQHHAGPRYTPDLSIEVPVMRAFEGLGQTDLWFDEVVRAAKGLRKLALDWKSAVANREAGGWDSPFPDDAREQGERAGLSLQTVLDAVEQLVISRNVPVPTTILGVLGEEALPAFRELTQVLARKVDEEHGEGRSESANFRQLMAEYEVKFPTANLDRASKLIESLEQLLTLLGSPATCVAGKNEFVLIGEAGSGKTHAICDAAVNRHERGLRTIVLFGERFSTSMEPWSQIIQQLGLPATVGRDTFLAALDAAGEASGSPLLLCVDGLNETVPRPYWPAHLASIVTPVRRYQFVRLILSCRTTYLQQVLPGTAESWFRVENNGFEGMQYDAFRAFCLYYKLNVPVLPLFPTEFSNPLFLRLLCVAAKENGYETVPTGWQGIYEVISALLKSLNGRFATRFAVSERHRIPEKALQRFVAAMRNSGRSALPFEEAAEIVEAAVPAGVQCGPLVDWLIAESLLIADAQPDAVSGRTIEAVRIAFDRLGDHLLASRYLESADADVLEFAFAGDGILAFSVANADATVTYGGLIEALSVQIPERFGVELLDCMDSEVVKQDVLDAVIKATITALPWRSRQHITYATKRIVWEALSLRGMGHDTFDALLHLSCQPSLLDACFLHSLLSPKQMPDRDAFWCPYLYRSFEESRPARRLIEAAFQIDSEQVDEQTAERWATALLWFCAANDRRVRDHATKSLVRLTADRPAIWVPLLGRFSSCDDEYVVERCILGVYGSLLRSRDLSAERAVAQAVFNLVFADSMRFQNAAIRDHARMVIELAAHDGVLPENIPIERCRPPYKSEWPLTVPSEERMKELAEDRNSYPHLYFSCTNGDFFIYTLHVTGKYAHVMSKTEMGRWIFQHVLDMGYSPERFANPDGFFIQKYGGGRGKPTWAERIGKKYQWIALARLVARLSDHNEAQDQFEHTPEPPDRISYLSRRDIDPSLLITGDMPDGTSRAWWQSVGYDYAQTPEDDLAWLNDAGDVPNSRSLISPKDPSGRNWLLLEGYFSWRENVTLEEDDESAFGHNRRNLWMHIHSYLVSEDAFKRCFAWAKRQDFMGDWMPRGREPYQGFLGEYPWATPFKDVDEWQPVEIYRGKTSPGCQLFVTCNALSCHYEYDASQAHGKTVHLPASIFFSSGQLRWNRADGFVGPSGELRTYDPTFTAAGPATLLMDPGFLSDFLSQHKLRIIWTVLSEKLVVVDRAAPRMRYSQVHTLGPKGIISSKPIVVLD